MTQPRLDWDAAPVVTSAVTMAPSAVAARRSGRRRAIDVGISRRMTWYRDTLIFFGALTDHEAADRMRKPLSVVNAIRGDWLNWAEARGIATPVQAKDRIAKDWGSGHSTSRTRWQWVEP